MKHNANVFLPRVFGLFGIKEELELIYTWYQKEVGMMLPHGLLFYGNPGYGKTLIVREYSKLFNCPIYEIEGDSEDLNKEIIDIYDRASKEKMAIVIIEEMDKLVRDDDKLARILQTQLDGYKERPHVLTLATANTTECIPEALLREGRFDRCFNVELQGKEETEEVVRGFLSLVHLAIDETDIYDLVDEFYRCPPIHIRSAINGALLRKGKECTAHDIIDSSYFLQCGTMPNRTMLEVDRRTAIHEAGHAAYLHFFAKFITYGRIYFTKTGGFTTIQRSTKLASIESNNEIIQCDLAGLIAEELLLGRHDFGVHEDLDDAHSRAYKLVNMQALHGANFHCQTSQYCRPSQEMSQIMMRRFENAAAKYVRRQYKATKRLMRTIEKGILRLSEFLLENKKASKQDIAKILG